MAILKQLLLLVRLKYSNMIINFNRILLIIYRIFTMLSELKDYFQSIINFKSKKDSLNIAFVLK